MKKGVLTVKLSYEDLCAYAPQPHPAPDSLDPAMEERICRMTMSQIEKKHRKTKLRRRTLLAAAIIAALTVSAMAAYAVSHAHTKALLETYPYGPEADSMALEETLDTVLEDYTQPLNLTSMDHGHTMTLESILGAVEENHSILYFTLKTDILAEGLPGEAGDWDFHGLWLDGLQWGYGGGATGTVLEDGTVGLMYVFYFREDINGLPIQLHLEDFGIATKQDNETLFCEGTWEFEFTPQLPAETAVPLEGVPAEDLNYAPADIWLSPFDVCVFYDQTVEDIPEESLTALERALDGTVRPDAPLEELLQAIEEAVENGLLTQEQADLAADYLEHPVVPRSVTLRLADGTERICRSNWTTLTPDGSRYMAQFLIVSPLDPSQITALVLDGVEIPYVSQ